MAAGEPHQSIVIHDVEANLGPRPQQPQPACSAPWVDASSVEGPGPLVTPRSSRPSEPSRSSTGRHGSTLLAFPRAADCRVRSDKSTGNTDRSAALAAESDDDGASAKSVWREKSSKSVASANAATILSNRTPRDAPRSGRPRLLEGASKDTRSFEYNPYWKSGSKAYSRHKRCCPPKLWVMLLLLFMLLIADLTFLTVTWVLTNQGAVEEMLHVMEVGVDELHDNFTNISRDQIEIIHKRSGQIQKSEIEQILNQTTTIVNLNSFLMNNSYLTSDRLDLDFILHWMWLQLSQEFLQVEGISFVFPNGLYMEYERDSQRVGNLGQSEETFTLEFAPPVEPNFSSGCTFCPPWQDMSFGYTYEFNVSASTGMFEGRARQNRTFNATLAPTYTDSVRGNGGLVWSGPYLTSSEPPATKGRASASKRILSSVALRAGRAYFRDGSVQAVLHADITLDYLTHRLQALTSADNAILFIMDFSGRLLSHSRGMDFVVKFDEDGSVGFIFANESRDERTRRVAADILSPRNVKNDSVTPKENTALIIDDGDQNRQNDIIYTDTIYTSGEGVNALRWIIVDAQFASEYLDPIENAINQTQEDVQKEATDTKRDQTASVLTISASLLGVSVAFSVAILTCVSQQITQPLRQIQKDMRAFARFDVDVIDKMATAIKVKHSARCGIVPSKSGCSVMIREIADICDSFSYMAAGLQSFARYMDAHLVQVLVRSRRQAQLGMAPADVTIFFSDLVGFTTLAESMDTNLLMEVLGTYLEEMSDIVMNYGGVVGEFIGDAIMAWWNAPPLEYGEGHSEAAVAAAVSQQDRLAKLNVAWQSQGLPQLQVRMGLARGTVLSGNLGSRKRMKYGLVGDSVNLASRLEGLCKRYGVSSLVDDNVHSALGVKDRFYLRPVDLVTVKGRTQPTELFELVGRRPPRVVEIAGQRPEGLAFCEEFASAHAFFRKGDFASALAVLDSYQQRWPNDQPARLLRDRCEELAASPPGPDWSPVTSLTEK